MSRFLLLAMAVAMASLAAGAATRGDITGDGQVNTTDVTALVSTVLSGGYDTACDLDANGQVNTADVTALVDLILNPQADDVNGHDYVWDPTVIPQIHLHVSLDEWNRLLRLYDANPYTKKYVMARATYVKGDDVFNIDSVGLRLKGNTSRRRPEGYAGQTHQPTGTQWNHVHWGLNFRKYVKDRAHTINGIRKVQLKWFKDDAAYVREMFCYNLFRDYGVWTAPRDIYCRLWVQVDGDPQETYYGVYELIEPIDDRYLHNRRDAGLLNGKNGNLWKCKNSGAGLNNTNADIWWDDDSDDNHAYTLQTNLDSFPEAREQLVDFMLKLNGKGDASFYKWIHEVCDVDLLLKTYAVNVAVGMWDDYWNNSNNYYLYFNTTDRLNYKVFFIPYDYDNTLGVSLQVGNQSDAGRQDPLRWGMDQNPLIRRLLAFDDLKAKYVAYLKQLVAQGGLMNPDASVERIKAWQARIAQYVDNDTHQDTAIKDVPASWGNHGEYRLLERGSNNFFTVKAGVINGL